VRGDAAPASASGEPKSSGRVAFDARGNPTWEWEMQTGVYGRDVNTARLKKLEANLTILETSAGFNAASPPGARPAADKSSADKSAAERPASMAPKSRPRVADAATTAGGNPYDNAAPVKPRPAPALSPGKARPIAAPPPKPAVKEAPGLLGWFANRLQTLFGGRR
jgi:hypothetical protein